jgi:hypothetical protein
MYARVKWSFVVFIALISRVPARSNDGEPINSAWLTRAQTEIKAILEKYEGLSRQLEEVIEIRAAKAPGPDRTIPFQPHTRRERRVRLGDDMIVEERRVVDAEPTKPQLRVDCDNSDYHFTLGKNKEDAPYVLVKHALGKQTPPLTEQGGGFHGEVFSYLRHALLAIEKSPKYTLRGLQFDNARGLLRFDITFPEGRGQERIYLDPSQDWRVVERSVETPNASGTDRFTYGEVVGGLTFPTGGQGLLSYKVAGAPPNLQMTTRVVSIKPTDKTPNDFRLTAFGLPEPKGVPLPRTSRWYLWFIALGVLSLGVGGYFRHRLRRHALAKTTAPVLPEGRS